MRIVIPGGTGQVGTLLARAFHAEGNEVVVLGRHATRVPWRFVEWDGRALGDWSREIDGADIVINLAGRSVNCRYTESNRREILDSRVESTTVVGQAIAASRRPPRIWLQASTATIYAHRFDAANDESSGIIGGGEPGAPDSWRFSIAVAKAWEDAARRTVPADTRLVLLRSAMIMSPDRGGIFATLLGLVRFGLGGPAGDGRQFVSWIHDGDFIRAVKWMIARDELSGAVNVASPNPLPYAHFMRALQRAAHVPFGLPAARWMIEIGTRMMRTESELVLKSRRVVPRRLLVSGFTFDFPTWPGAATDLVSRLKEKRNP
jgi:uncharacterized protein (TIGR01777 family)